MALFGKKKQAEPAAPQLTPEDDIQMMSGDASDFDKEENASPAIDFDAINDELNGDVSTIDLSKSGAAQTEVFAPTADFAANDTRVNADDDLDFNAVFDDGAPANTIPVASADSDENPFGDGPIGATADLPTIEPVSDAPPLTYTAPLLTADAVATAGRPVARKSPLPMLLAAIGLLAALGGVGYYVMGSQSAPEETVVATNPSLRAPRASDNAVNLGAAVDGVPIAPGAVIQTALIGPRPTVPLTPGLLKQLKDLWKQGAAAKNKGDIAGARAAWTKMLQLRPNHPGVQDAINKLPAA